MMREVFKLALFSAGAGCGAYAAHAWAPGDAAPLAAGVVLGLFARVVLRW